MELLVVYLCPRIVGENCYPRAKVSQRDYFLDKSKNIFLDSSYFWKYFMGKSSIMVNRSIWWAFFFSIKEKNKKISPKRVYLRSGQGGKILCKFSSNFYKFHLEKMSFWNIAMSEGRGKGVLGCRWQKDRMNLIRFNA